jgi:hypothetical protein
MKPNELFNSLYIDFGRGIAYIHHEVVLEYKLNMYDICRIMNLLSKSKNFYFSRLSDGMYVINKNIEY